jgi:hypothetical protein
MNTRQVVAWMNDKRRARFNYLFNLTFKSKPKLVPLQPSNSDLLPAIDADKLLQDGLIEPADPNSDIYCIPFTVTEERHEEIRRRFIIWTKQLNEWLKANGYEADVPLEHISAYLAAANDEFGGTRDVRYGFYQVEIPVAARKYFTFKDATGRVFQMTRLPMGLSSAPEMMHMLTATLARDRCYVPAERAAPAALRVKVWIDNVCTTGPKDKVEAYFRAFDADCITAHCTLNEKDSTIGTKYKFLGVIFDHTTHQVCCGPKLVDKVRLALQSLKSSSIGDLERLVGRLLHAAAILQVPLHQFWWLLKSVRRRLSLINSGKRTRADSADLTGVALEQLTDFCHVVVANVPTSVIRHKGSKSLTLFTDATLDGWGAVLIDNSTQRVRVTGGAWHERAHNIGAAETRAVTMALDAFRLHLEHASVDVRIDNTSAMQAVRKQHARSFAINAELEAYVSTFRGLKSALSFGYIASSDNPADAPSRRAAVNKSVLHRAVRACGLRTGEGESPCSSSTA